MKSHHCLTYFLIVIISSACGSSLRPSQTNEKRKNTETPRRAVRLEYAASLEPSVDPSGVLMIPGQRLDRWSGRTFVGSSGFDVVPVD
ncbi:MAG: hypothetical protein M3Q07_27670 [Pseudobdellovibrionaceae bacterium]|uniref:hypothetical protein n=1 Tax=Oligoflexus sp. TaxID=1971216 RepID=UPI0027C9DBA1|nr:hypothetical protein [Oligoflexus sp.]MDQ3235606.1 hypothetical protein [Pseudobdellovibrionaceae bacterium]HYX34664.1 hypothetical protein [Oligoflexus sp.]